MTPHDPVDKSHSPWPFRIWLACMGLMAWVVTVVATAWAVKHAMVSGFRLSAAQTEAILAVPKFPGLVRDVALQLVGEASGEASSVLLLEKVDAEKSHWQRKFPAPADSGYLLLSGVDPRAKRSVVTLLRVSDGREMARWVPDWEKILAQPSSGRHAERILPSAARAMHPLLLPDGDVVFNTGSAMVRMAFCTGQPRWVLHEVVHHSNELGPEGHLWAPSVTEGGFPKNDWLSVRLRDDAIAEVSPEGQLLRRTSFSAILQANGLSALLLGTQGFQINADPIHMNQIAVAQTTTGHWQRGDLLISARHLSTVFLYRPSTGRIVWHQTGPWMNQHSAAFVGDHQISVFSNHVVAGAPRSQAFVQPGEVNRVMVHDFATQTTREPYAALLAQARPVTMTEGRAQVLADGGLFVEETNWGRHLRFTQEGLLWSRVNDYDAQRIGLVSWSRYLTAQEVAVPLQAMARARCGVEP